MRSIVKKIVFLSFGNGAAVVSNTISLAVASRYLSQGNYATFRQTFLPFEALVPILSLGVPSAVYYLLPRRSDKFNLFIECTTILLIASSLFSLFITLGGSSIIANKFNNPALNDSLKYLIFYPYFQLPISLFISVLIYEGKTRLVGAYSSLSSLILCAAVIISSIKYENYNYLIFFKAILPIFGFIILLLLIYKHYLPKLQLYNGFKNNITSILAISLPLGLASMIGAISQQMDKILVSYFSKPDDFAIYINGAVEIPLIGIITGSISSVLLGEMSDSVKKGDLIRSHHLFKLTANKSALFLFPAMIFFYLTSKDFIIALFSPKYLLSAVTFKIYLFLIPIRIVVFGSALIALGKGKVIFKRSIIELILNILLSVILFKYIGFNGIAIATVIIVYLWSVPYNIIEVCDGFKIKPSELFDYYNLLKIFTLSLAFSPIILLFNVLNLNIYVFLITSAVAYFIIIAISFNKLKLIKT